MTLPGVLVGLIGLALVLYVLLDGYDLGIGVLTLIDRDVRRRRSMQQLVAWTWDGNESWLVLVAVGLWAGLPLVIATLLPALYIVLMLMLFALIGRGVALDLIEQNDGWHRIWGPVFGVASLVVAFCQGVAFGAVVGGLPLRDGAVSGGPLEFLHFGYSIVPGLTAVALYTLAGSAFVVARLDAEDSRRAAGIGRIAVWAIAGGVLLSWVLAPIAGPVVLQADGARIAIWAPGAIVLIGGLLLAGRSLRHSARRWGAAVGVVAIVLGGLTITIGLLAPMVIPPDITVVAAESPRSSLVFATIGVGIFLPVILLYQAWGYVVFRRTPRRDDDAVNA